MRWSLLVLVACSKAPLTDDTDVGTDDTDVVADTDTDADSDTDTDSDADTDSDTDTDTDTDVPIETVRFVALGDGGEGNASQKAVGAVVATVCASRGCDFALYLGDNFYNTGVSDVDDEQFQDKFEIPYADVDIPFHVVLGNHDYGGEGIGIEFWKADPQIEYTDHSDKWSMPDRYYSFLEDEVQFVGLDSNAILYGLASDQEEWIEERWLEPAKWRIGFGHHPYISNGKHGNAGNYEGIEDWIPLVEIPRGDYVKEFFDDHVCGKADVYFSGHDHDRQWLEPTCGTTFVVSGAAAKTTDDEERGNDTFFEDYSTPGFAWVEIAGEQLTMAFYDETGKLEFEHTVTR